MLLPSHARGTMSVLRPEARHLSPAVGLALSSGGCHLLSRLFELEPTLADGALIETAAGVRRWKGSPVCRLARELFHRQHPAETLQITANRSLPASHLSPSLAAHVVGLARMAHPGDAAVHAALRAATCSETGLSLPAVARETGVSIARFERLVEVLAEADTCRNAPGPPHSAYGPRVPASCPPHVLEAQGGLPRAGTAVRTLCECQPRACSTYRVPCTVVPCHRKA